MWCDVRLSKSSNQFFSQTDVITPCNDSIMSNVSRSSHPLRHYSVFYNRTSSVGDYVTRRTQPMSTLRHVPGWEERGKRGKVGDETRRKINDLILDNNIDFMFLTETWLVTDGPASLLETSPPNYNFSYSSRTAKKGGSTATILSASLVSPHLANTHLLNITPLFLATLPFCVW